MALAIAVELVEWVLSMEMAADDHSHQQSVHDPFGDDGLDPITPESMTTALPARLEEWRKRTATGALLTGIALGLQHVFDPDKRNQPAIVQEAPSEPEDDGPTSVKLDPDQPADTLFVIRPWLLRKGDS